MVIKIILMFYIFCFILINRKPSIFFLNNSTCNSSEFQIEDNKPLCNRFFNCEDYKNNIHLIYKLNSGLVKTVWLAKWKYKYIVVSFLNEKTYFNDFLHNIYMLRNFTIYQSIYTSKYLGNCNQTILFTEFYKFGSLLNLPFLINSKFHKRPLIQYYEKNSILKNSLDCFQICISYIKIINYLHTSPIGVRVMCDSNDLIKLLSQFLIKDDFNLIANDLDALPDSMNNLIRCGNRLIQGDIIAPEQIALQNITTLPTYNHKIDIWKVPIVCDWFLSLCEKSSILKSFLNPIHLKCRNISPNLRPNASEILNRYLLINHTMFYDFLLF